MPAQRSPTCQWLCTCFPCRSLPTIRDGLTSNEPLLTLLLLKRIVKGVSAQTYKRYLPSVLIPGFATTGLLTYVQRAIWPLWWSNFSETLGRRTIYLTSFAMFAICGVLSAVSTNIAMLIVMRMLNGGAAASVQAVGAGTIADLWEPFERGRAMGYFYLGPLLGPLLAPIIGGEFS